MNTIDQSNNTDKDIRQTYGEGGKTPKEVFDAEYGDVMNNTDSCNHKPLPVTYDYIATVVCKKCGTEYVMEPNTDSWQDKFLKFLNTMKLGDHTIIGPKDTDSWEQRLDKFFKFSDEYNIRKPLKALFKSELDKAHDSGYQKGREEGRQEGVMEESIKRYEQAKEDGTLDKHYPKL